jgi:iron complex outermembrane receptor protein
LSEAADWGRWTLGLYYFHEDMDGAVIIPGNFGGVLPYGQYFSFYYGGGSIDTDAWAAYGQLTYDLTERLSLTVGARYSDEKKAEVDLYTDFINSLDFLGPYVPGSPTTAPPFHQSASFSSFTPRIGLEFQVTPDTMLYASASEGFKAGGFNLGGAYTPPGEPDNPQNEPLKPEEIKALEVGLKTTMMDRRLRTNLAAFYYDYKNLQVSQVTSLTVLLKNAAAAEIYGAEAEISFLPIDPLQLDLTGSWLHARFTDFKSTDPNLTLGEQDLSGATLPQAPDFSVTAAAEYTIPVAGNSLSIRGEYFWTDRNYFLEFNRDVLSQPAYSKVNVSATFQHTAGNWLVMGYCSNCTDETVVVSGGESGAGRGYPITGIYAPPREYGIQLTKRF